MGETKPHPGPEGCRSGPPVIAWLVALLLISETFGCGGPRNRFETVPPVEQGTAAMPDESQLLVPSLHFTNLVPADPQPAAASLHPGLSVVYYFDYFARNLNPLTSGDIPADSGLAGRPIPYLNHRFGRGEVFDSGTNRGVAARMKGLIHFPDPGAYTLRAFSNDGLRIRIADVRIIDDPAQHSDRYAVQAVVVIQQAGWYPLTVEYFQRKGTASLGLFWRTPTESDFAPVPAGSYAHLP